MSIFIFFIGLIIGSFLNVCIYRIPKGESISYPPSKCNICGEYIKPYDLIPIISYLLLKGKCRNCGTTLSLQYPVVELLNGFICLMLYFKFGFSLIFLKYILITSLLLVISIIDYKFMIIPNKLIIFGFIIVSILNILYNFPSSYLNGLIGLLFGGGIFLIIALVTKGAMGGGDIKLISLIGFALGFKVLMIILCSFIIGALLSIILLLTKIKSRKDYIPFGPFISISTIIVLFFYKEILTLYFNLII